MLPLFFHTEGNIIVFSVWVVNILQVVPCLWANLSTWPLNFKIFHSLCLPIWNYQKLCCISLNCCSVNKYHLFCPLAHRIALLTFFKRQIFFTNICLVFLELRRWWAWTTPVLANCRQSWRWWRPTSIGWSRLQQPAAAISATSARFRGASHGNLAPSNFQWPTNSDRFAHFLTKQFLKYNKSSVLRTPF